MVNSNDNNYLEKYKNWKKLCGEIASDLQLMDPNRRTISHIDNVNNWMLGINGATLVYNLYNFDKFIIFHDLSESFLPEKLIYITMNLLFLLSALSFSILKLVIYGRYYNINKSLDFIEAIPDIKERADQENSWKEIEGWKDIPLEQKEENRCNCMGVVVFDPKSCNFPGVGQYYEPEIDQEAPVEPPSLRDKPPEPVIPPAPEAPANKYDQVAMAQYMNALQSYQDEVTHIQDDYKNQMQLYESEAKVYQAEMVKYQETRSKYDIARNSAVKGAEGLIDSITKQFGWAWVDKDNPKQFRPWLFRTWIAQGVLVLGYFLVILVLVKRKDVS